MRLIFTFLHSNAYNNLSPINPLATRFLEPYDASQYLN
jgi:hypothetical protein